VYPNSGALGGHFKFKHGQSLSTYEYKKAMQRRQARSERAAQVEAPEVEFEPLEPEVGPSAHESIEVPVGAEEGLGYSSFINSLLLVLANSPHDPDHAPHDQHYHG
jgi:hypothetical protein